MQQTGTNHAGQNRTLVPLDYDSIRIDYHDQNRQAATGWYAAATGVVYFLFPPQEKNVDSTNRPRARPQQAPNRNYSEGRNRQRFIRPSSTVIPIHQPP